MYHEILVPTDGSDGSLVAVDHAIDLAERYDASLHALYVIQTEMTPDAGLAGVYDAFKETGEEAVEAVLDRARAAGVRVTQGEVLTGTAHAAILDYVTDHDVDLIVMGTHGRTGLDRYLIGSVTEKVVRLADIPVLTVRVPKHNEDS